MTCDINPVEGILGLVSLSLTWPSARELTRDEDAEEQELSSWDKARSVATEMESEISKPTGCLDSSTFKMSSSFGSSFFKRA